MVSCGIEESREKACPPHQKYLEKEMSYGAGAFTKMIFIGVLFDTDEMTLSVSEEILELVSLWLQKKISHSAGIAVSRWETELLCACK